MLTETMAMYVQAMCLEKEYGKDVSRETVEIALQAHFKANPEKPKFEPIDVCHVNIDVNSHNHIVIKVSKGEAVHCEQFVKEARRTASAINKAADFAEANKD